MLSFSQQEAKLDVGGEVGDELDGETEEDGMDGESDEDDVEGEEGKDDVEEVQSESKMVKQPVLQKDLAIHQVRGIILVI